MLIAYRRRGVLDAKAGMLFGPFSGPFCGAGIALGGFFQNTTANIHSGYSFAAVLEWLLLAAGGGVLGLATGIALGSAARGSRRAIAAFVVLTALATTGWIISAARPTI